MERAIQAANDAWRDELANVRVRGGTPDERVIFHSALYRAYHMPMVHSDVDGRYRGLDDVIHTADRTHYSTFSLWDTFRTQHPWLILARPERQVDMVQSLVQMAEDGGSLPRWPMTHGYTGGMVGTPADQVFAETWLKGLQTDWDVASAWEVAVRQSTQPMPAAGRAGIEGYLDRGYVVFEEASGPAAFEPGVPAGGPPRPNQPPEASLEANPRARARAAPRPPGGRAAAVARRRSIAESRAAIARGGRARGKQWRARRR